MKSKSSWLTLAAVSGSHIGCLLPGILILTGVSFALYSRGLILHTFLETIALSLGLVSFILALIHYYLTQHVVVYVFGIITFAASLMDLFHVLASAQLLPGVESDPNFVPMTWAIARMFYAFTSLCFLVFVMVAVLKQREQEWLSHSFKTMYRILPVGIMVSAAMATVVILCAYHIQMPLTLYPGQSLTRPYDFGAFMLYLLGMCVSTVVCWKRPDALYITIYVSTVVSVYMEGYMAFGSSRVFDSGFNVAHTLKIFSVLVLIVGWTYDIGIKAVRRTQYDMANRMLRYVNHEVRNPLNCIKGLLTLSLMELQQVPIQDQEAITSNLETASASCDLISHVVNDVLDINRIEDGRLDLTYAPVRLDGLVRDIQKSIQPKLDERPDLQYSTDILEPEAVVNIDRHRVTQIILNFLSNAIKFTDSGRITLRIKLQSPSCVRFEVQDTGRGIPDKQKANVFKPFSQTRSEDTTRHGGVGLGLYLCKLIVDVMQGSIGFESQDSHGSVFWIELSLPAVTDDVV